jgi:hypothetical protein
MTSSEPRNYKLMKSDGSTYLSDVPGEIGGHLARKIYGRLDCWSARKILALGSYAEHRVFFENEMTAVASGFRPSRTLQLVETWRIFGNI